MGKGDKISGGSGAGAGAGVLMDVQCPKTIGS